MSPETAFQTAALDRLKGDPAVKAALGDPARVYAIAPNGARFPFLSTGRGETEPADGSGTELVDHRLTLHLWGRRDDRDAVKDAAAAVRAALHQADLTLPAPYACILCRVVYTDLFTGADGRTLHAVVRARALVEML
ncbi:MAG: DUF3168 domain-containing protein [Alphaproteobacteria bacterium]|nr:DUF3168 domain-containing protein [Alphaproteobacteria bacterium]